MRICEANTRILRANSRPKTDAMFIEFQLALPRISESPYRGESNSMQGASVKQTRSVCSERARTPAGGRSRCGFAKQIRGFSAQCLSSISMRCRSGVLPRPQPINGFPRTAENRTLRRARALGKRRGSAGWDALSQRRSKRKAHPGIPPQTGTRFPLLYPHLQNPCALHSKTG